MYRPKYLRSFYWTKHDQHSSPSAASTEICKPLPRPSPVDLRNKEALNTIATNPDLFAIISLINVNALKRLLKTHPNRPFVDSVLTGLREGFWPWADTATAPEGPLDYNQPRDLPEAELKFIKGTCRTEYEAGRFSGAFGPNLLPGMVSEPLFAVPKPRSTKF